MPVQLFLFLSQSSLIDPNMKGEEICDRDDIEIT